VTVLPTTIRRTAPIPDRDPLVEALRLIGWCRTFGNVPVEVAGRLESAVLDLVSRIAELEEDVEGLRETADENEKLLNHVASQRSLSDSMI
jgi:hypothetical protein